MPIRYVEQGIMSTLVMAFPQLSVALLQISKTFFFLNGHFKTLKLKHLNLNKIMTYFAFSLYYQVVLILL